MVRSPRIAARSRIDIGGRGAGARRGNARGLVSARWTGAPARPAVRDHLPGEHSFDTGPHVAAPRRHLRRRTRRRGQPFTSHFGNAPFSLDRYAPSRGTDDLQHNFYQGRYQLDQGRLNRYVVANNKSAGLAMGYWNTRALPTYKYLHRRGHARYAIADRFFQAAFGGSFLNHQWLVAARTPVWPDAVNDGRKPDDRHAVVDANGMPGTYPKYRLYKSPLPDAKDILEDGQLTASCRPPAGHPEPKAGTPCGDFAVNTIDPSQQPYYPGVPRYKRLAASFDDRGSPERQGCGWTNGKGLKGGRAPTSRRGRARSGRTVRASTSSFTTRRSTSSRPSSAAARSAPTIYAIWSSSARWSHGLATRVGCGRSASRS